MRKDPATSPVIPRGLIPAVITAVLLSVPMVAMQFTTEVKWGLFDFVLVGILVFGTAFAFEMMLRRGGSLVYRIAVGLALLSALLMTWANLAVGLLGGESGLTNAWLMGVVVIGIAGAAACRLRPAGMAVTLLAMAIAHAVLTAIALKEGWKPLRHGPIDIWAPNALFILLFLAASVLFWIAAEDSPSGEALPVGEPRTSLSRIIKAAALMIIGAALGGMAVFVGAIDDAPGASFGGLLVIVATAVLSLKVALRGRY